MEKVSQKDREILREIAARKAALAHSARNDEILKMWDNQAKGIRDTPTVRLLFSNFPEQVVGSRLRCEGESARKLESQLLASLVGRELFDDDTPLSDRFEVELFTTISPFGTPPHLTRMQGNSGYHIDPLTDDIEADIDLFRGGSFKVDPEGTKEWCAFADSIFGDILPSKIVQSSLKAQITNPLIKMIGMETYYVSMYDAPETLHEIMEMATNVFESYYDHLEQNGLCLPTNGFSMVRQESFAFTEELPAEGPITSTKQMWGFTEAQEATAISPDMFGEFVYPYYDRLVKRFGLLSYGCCERVDTLWEKYISKWKNLRKLSVSPFNDERKIGEFLRGSNIVYYSKPRAEHVTNVGPLDEEVILNYFKEVCECASGCLFEVAQREVGTIYGDFARGKRYVELLKQAIAQYWKP